MTPRAHAAAIFLLPTKEWEQMVSDGVPEHQQQAVRTHLKHWYMIAKSHSNCDDTCRFCRPKSAELAKQREAFRETLQARRRLNEPTEEVSSEKL